MMSSFLNLEGLQYFFEKIEDIFVRKESGKGLSSNDFTTAEKNKLAGIATGANAYTHPSSGVTAGTYRSVSVDTQGHVTAGTNPTTLAAYGITDAKIAGGVITLGGATITPLTSASSLAAAKITGTISLDNLPAGALERCVVVADDTARFALTTATVQKGDTVKVTSSGLMYFIVDDTKLDAEAGYEVYTAGSATSVPWAGVTDKPSTFAPSTHTHTAAQVTGLATVATSGKYTDLSGTPTSLPANGGNAATVNGLTVLTAVPANAKFTDTVYSHPTTSGNKHIPTGGKSGQILRWSADGTAIWGSENDTTYEAITTAEIDSIFTV